MWEITVKLRPIPSSLENPEGTREAIACDLEKYGTVRYVDIKDSAFKPEQIKLEETTIWKMF